MPTKPLLACCGLLFLLSGCNNPVAVGAGFLAPTTPPLNTIVFGPCEEEFAMDPSRKANCELHYRLWGGEAPWVTRQKYFAATAYQPGELQCTQTRGQVAECAVVSGPPHQPPYIAAPNNLKSE
ncbi:MAG TPA: hypothetical protein VMH36_18450 [Alphaproteobacteria bacterium]|nr:hypothetical protein [Alphaproteobacteria bacterium]